MLKMKLFTIGKCKEKWLLDAIADYTKRLENQLSIEWILAKDTKRLCELLVKNTRYIALDPRGRAVSSEDFSLFLKQEFITAGARLSFVIGGAEGLPSSILKNATECISLSPLTFTHQLTRLILLEQLYRAIEILKGSPYHRASSAFSLLAKRK